MGKMIENYSLQNEIGRGMYSTVFRAVNMKTKQEVAIKQVRAEKFKQFPKLEEGTYNEINILSNLESCPHIIKYFDMLKTVNNFYFVYEYCNGGTLEKLLKEKGSLPERQAIAYFAQIVEAFRVLNKNNIMHRDLKPENLLLHDGIIKLADFGFCKPLENEDEISKTMLGSPIYMAPEILKGESYSIKSDIWSLGVVLFRMLYGYCPFESNNIGKLIMAIDQEDLKIPDKPFVSPEVLKLMRRMITKNPNLRAQWSQVFAYQVRNGELYRLMGIRDKSSNKMKGSFTKSQVSTIAPTSSSINQLPLSAKDLKPQLPLQNSELIYSPRPNSELRSTFTGKNPFRESSKKELLIKNHQKCVDIFSLAVSLAIYEQPEALALATLLVRNVDREMVSIQQSVKKEIDFKNDEQMMRTFMGVLEGELSELRNLMLALRDSLRTELDQSVEMVEIRKRELLKRFVASLQKQKIDELVLASRVVDYVVDDMVIRRETFEKMSRDKLLSNIRSKMEGLP